MLRSILRVPIIFGKAAPNRAAARTLVNLPARSTKSDGKSCQKNSANSLLRSSTTYVSQSDLRSSFASAIKYYSSANNTDLNSESVGKTQMSSADSNLTRFTEALISQVTAHVQRGDINKSLEYATKAVEKSKTADELLNSLTLKLALSAALQKSGWEDEFLSALKRMDPESPQFHEIWERVLGTLVGSFKSYHNECKALFEQALNAYPNNFIIILKQAEVLLSFRLANEAENCLNKAIEIDAHKCRPWTLLWTIHPTKTSYLKKAVECPDAEKDTFLWSEYAKKQIFEENDVDAGMESLKKAVADRPILPGVEKTLSEISTQLAVKGDFVSAERVARLWLEESPKKAAAWSILGSVNNAQKRVSEAEKCFRKAIELDPKIAVAWFNLGNMLPPQEGIPMLLQALKLNPSIHQAHYRLAMHYSDLEQYNLALESINKAIEMNDQISDYKVLKSMILPRIKSEMKIWIYSNPQPEPFLFKALLPLF